MLLIVLAGTAAPGATRPFVEPVLAALTDPTWAARHNHAAALAALRGAPPADPAAASRARVPIAGDGPLYRLPALGRTRPDPEAPRDTALVIAAAGAAVVAPAAGRVAYAGPFRRYGKVLILDHGHGWTTVLTGLARIDVAQGIPLLGGDTIGAAGATLHVQLLHHGRAADVARIAARLGG